MEKSESSIEPLPPPSQGKYISILSIDGGGIRGLIPAVMLKYLETQLQDLEKSKDARLADYFDVITGTSTGGLITGMLTTPKQDTRRPLFTAQEIIDFYLEQSPKIFPQYESGCCVPIIGWLYSECRNALRFIRSFFWGPKYDGKYLHQKAEELLGSTILNDTLTNVVIPTFDIKKFQPVIFSSYLGKRESSIGSSKLSDVCIASSAAPTYLPSHYFKTQSKEFNCIDGGMAANDPALVAISEVTREIYKENPDFGEMNPLDYTRFIVVSLGTGAAETQGKYNSETVNRLGLVGWVLLITDVLMGASSDMVDYHMQIVFETLESKGHYLRVQDDTLSGDLVKMDYATRENLIDILKFGEAMLDKPVSGMHTVQLKLIRSTQKRDTTYKAALRRYAELLYEERRSRIKEKNSTSLNQSFE